jgi:protein-tyrosine phosphatase
LATIAHPRGDAWPAERLSALAAAGVSVLVSALTPAELQQLGLGGTAEQAGRSGLEFIAFPAADGDGPRDEAAEVVRLARRLAEHVEGGRFVVTQSFGGLGRSTLLACTTLVLLGVSPAEALHRANGDTQTPVTRDWLYDVAASRLSAAEDAMA